MPDCSWEYDCRDCGRHIVQFGGPQTGLCAACTTMPGWYNNPEVDPDHLRRPRRELH